MSTNNDNEMFTPRSNHEALRNPEPSPGAITPDSTITRLPGASSDQIELRRGTERVLTDAASSHLAVLPGARMEPLEISEHLVRVVAFVRERKSWVTVREIAEGARVAPRTANFHALLLVNLRLFDRREVYPGYGYKFSEYAEERNKAFMQRILAAEEVFSGRCRSPRCI